MRGGRIYATVKSRCSLQSACSLSITGISNLPVEGSNPRSGAEQINTFPNDGRGFKNGWVRMSVI